MRRTRDFDNFRELNGDVDVFADAVSPVCCGCADVGNGGDGVNGDVGGFGGTAENAGCGVIGLIGGVVCDTAICANYLIPGGKGNGIGDSAVVTCIGNKSEFCIGITR